MHKKKSTLQSYLHIYIQSFQQYLFHELRKHIKYSRDSITFPIIYYITRNARNSTQFAQEILLKFLLASRDKLEAILLLSRRRLPARRDRYLPIDRATIKTRPPFTVLTGDVTLRQVLP